MIYTAKVLEGSKKGKPCLLYMRDTSVLKDSEVYSNIPSKIFLFNWASFSVFRNWHTILEKEGEAVLEEDMGMDRGKEALANWKKSIFKDMHSMPLQFQKYLLSLIPEYIDKGGEFFKEYTLRDAFPNGQAALLLEIKLPWQAGTKNINWGTSADGQLIASDSYRITTTPNLNYLIFGYDLRTPITNLNSVPEFVDIMPTAFAEAIENSEYMTSLFKRTALKPSTLSF